MNVEYIVSLLDMITIFGCSGGLGRAQSAGLHDDLCCWAMARRAMPTGGVGG
jgi:hypothetical protein